jgi:capsular exopolysaccharide synthesis family protein
MLESSGGGTALVEFLDVAWRRKRTVVVAALVVPAVAVFHAVQQPDVFTANAQVLLTPQTAAVRYAGGPSTSAAEDPVRYAATQTFLAKSPQVASRVVERAHVPGLTAEGLLASSDVVAATDANLLTFKTFSVDPVVARRLANMYATAFTQYRRTVDTRALESAISELQTRLPKLQDMWLKSQVLDRIQSLQTTEALQRQSTYVARPAAGAVQIAPRPKRDAILGLGLGLVLGIGLAYLREALDTRLRTSDEIALRLGLPLLAKLSTPPKRLRDSNRLVMIEEAYTPNAEMFRMLRTSLDLANLDRHARTLMITSAVAGEGKTTTAANLAVALAAAGRRAIVVDLDLRRPSIHRMFALRQLPGLTDVALQDVRLEDAIVRTQLDGVHSGGELSVLTAGPIPPDPGEFVGTTVVAQILKELAERYDVVVIDTPPMFHAVEAMTLSAHVDAILVVTRLSAARRGTMAELRRLLDRAPAAKLGFILTESDGGTAHGTDYGYDYAYAYPKDDLVR